MIRQTIQISDILDNHLKTGPYDDTTCLDHSETGHVWYSDVYCTKSKPRRKVSGVKTHLNFNFLKELSQITSYFQ